MNEFNAAGTFSWFFFLSFIVDAPLSPNDFHFAFIVPKTANRVVARYVLHLGTNQQELFHI